MQIKQPQSNVVVTKDGRRYQEPSKNRKFAAAIAGFTGYIAANSSVTLGCKQAMNKMYGMQTATDMTEIQKALPKALEVSGMSAKGVHLLDYSKPEVEKAISTTITNFKPKNVMDYLYHKAVSDSSVLTSEGKNAFFWNTNKIFDKNSIHINTKKLGLAGFHEIGHSINYNTSKLLKNIQTSRLLFNNLPGLLLWVALTKKPKIEGEKPQGFLDKTTTFIKNNVGKLCTLAILPILAEELIATSKGNKLAKQLLSPENYKKVVKGNTCGAITYALTAIGAGVGAYVANKIRDKIAAPKEINNI